VSEQPENAAPDEAPTSDQPAPLEPDPPTAVFSETVAAGEPVEPVWTAPPPPSASSSSGPTGPAAIAQQRPEVAVGAAFAGGFVVALILKRLAR
jgi:hypothetical protein